MLFTLLAGTAVAVTLLEDLFAAVMLSGIFSLLSAGLFVVMGAVDVAFTEAAVGAGVATILMLEALDLTPTAHERPKRARRPRVQSLPLIVVLLTGAALVFGTLDMPPYGDPLAPIHHHVAPRYIEASPHEIGAPNMVTSVLAAYRGFDTLGEAAVIFTAAIGVLLLLGAPRRGSPGRPAAEEEIAP